MKPNIPIQLHRVVEKLDLQSTMILQGILLDHALKLIGLVEKPKPKTIIEL